MPRWKEAKIIKTIDRSETTRSFWLEIQDIDIFEFNPGQFVTFDLPIGEKRLDRWRSYSIANHPNGGNVIELVIVRVPFGKATTYLFDEINVGDTLKMKGPDGVFTLPEIIDKNLVMICTGTGVAPFRSMLHHIQEQNIPHKNLHLIFGTRYESGILYHDEWKKLASDNESFKFDIALSRESYNEYQGYVHDIYQQKYTSADTNLMFYLCGWQKMVDEAKQNILALGFDKSQIVEELYG